MPLLRRCIWVEPAFPGGKRHFSGPVLWKNLKLGQLRLLLVEIPMPYRVHCPDSPREHFLQSCSPLGPQGENFAFFRLLIEHVLIEQDVCSYAGGFFIEPLIIRYWSALKTFFTSYCTTTLYIVRTQFCRAGEPEPLEKKRSRSH